MFNLKFNKKMNTIADEYQWNLYKKEHNLCQSNKTVVKKQKVKNTHIINKTKWENYKLEHIYKRKTPDELKENNTEVNFYKDNDNYIEHSIKICYEI